MGKSYIVSGQFTLDIMRTTTAIVISAILLASALFMFVQPGSVADSSAPEITNITRSQKYPMEAEVVTFNATVTDIDNIIDVSLFICFPGTCDMVTMTDPDGDSVFGAVFTMHTDVTYADIQISATDEFSNNNLTDLEYFPIVHWINLTTDATPSFPVIDESFWVNGTAVYDENNSAPAEQSPVKLEILETAEEWTTYVDSTGNYSFALAAPSVHGSYNLNITVTNRTMAANVTLPLDVADIDTDGDGTPNYLDEDDDDDGLTDLEEAALGTSPIDPDTDDDDYNDNDDAFPLNNTEWSDNDEDGFGDNIDDDDDNDGLTDAEEADKGTDPMLADTDGDGVDDMEDYDPLDPSIWDSPAEPLDPMIWVVLAIVIIIVVVIAAVTLSSRRAPPE